MSTLTITITTKSKPEASELAYNVSAMIYQESEVGMLKIGFLKCHMFGPNDEMTYDYQEPFDVGLTFKFEE